jgi:hypothetical protein
LGKLAIRHAGHASRMSVDGVRQRADRQLSAGDGDAEFVYDLVVRRRRDEQCEVGRVIKNVLRAARAASAASGVSRGSLRRAEARRLQDVAGVARVDNAGDVARADGADERAQFVVEQVRFRARQVRVRGQKRLVVEIRILAARLVAWVGPEPVDDARAVPAEVEEERVGRVDAFRQPFE